MSFRDTQNPGIGGLDEITDAETLILQNIASLSYENGDILFYNSGFDRLPKGDNDQVLTLVAGLPSWEDATGGGDVSKVGTPVNNQVGVWTGDGTIEGDADLTFDTATNTLSTVNIAASGTVDGRDVSVDGTKLDGIEAAADVTDTANVTAAGALMDSELADLTAIKTLQAPDNTTISTFGASLVDDTTAEDARATLGTVGYTLQAGFTNQSPSDSTTYHIGPHLTLLHTEESLARIYIPKAGTIKAVYLNFWNGASGADATASTMSIRLNNTTDTTISSAVVNNATHLALNNTALSIAVAAGDFISIKWVTPAWAGSNSIISFSAVIYIE